MSHGRCIAVMKLNVYIFLFFLTSLSTLRFFFFMLSAQRFSSNFVVYFFVCLFVCLFVVCLFVCFELWFLLVVKVGGHSRRDNWRDQLLYMLVILID